MNDYATGAFPLTSTEVRELVEQNVRDFNERHGITGWDATIDFFHWGDWVIHITHFGAHIQSIYEDLDAFECFESKVDEGLYMEASA